MGETTAAMTAKSVSAGGLSMLLLAMFNDVEFVVLLSTGIFASMMSFVYDYTHRDMPKQFRFKELMELFKYVFYGIPMMFIVYYMGVHNAGQYITLPNTVWGFIGMLCAGSAVAIVEYLAPLAGKFISSKASK